MSEVELFLIRRWDGTPEDLAACVSVLQEEALTAESEALLRRLYPRRVRDGEEIMPGFMWDRLAETEHDLAAIEAAAAREALAGEAIALLCDMGLGLDMGTSAPVSGALRDALAARYEETERNGIGKGMTVEDWRECIDAELDRAARASDGGR